MKRIHGSLSRQDRPSLYSITGARGGNPPSRCVLLTSAILARMMNSPASRTHVISSPPAMHPRAAATRGLT